MRRFFVDEILGPQGSVAITGAEAKHIATVLRMEPGDQIVILDKVGNRFLAVIKELSRRHVLVNLERPVPAPDPSPVRITLCQALLKSNAMDFLVEKTSELGVNRVLPYIADRTVVKVDGEKAMARPGIGRKLPRAPLSSPIGRCPLRSVRFTPSTNCSRA